MASGFAFEVRLFDPDLAAHCFRFFVFGDIIFPITLFNYLCKIAKLIIAILYGSFFFGVLNPAGLYHSVTFANLQAVDC